MPNELTIVVESLQIKAKLIYNLMQFNLELHNQEYDCIIPYISPPSYVISCMLDEPLRFSIPTHLSVSTSRPILKLQLHQQLNGQIETNLLVNISFQCDEAIVFQSDDVYLNGRSELTRNAEQMCAGVKLLTIPLIKYVPHQLIAPLFGAALRPLFLRMQLRTYTIQAQLEGNTSSQLIIVSEADMHAATGAIRSFDVFVYIDAIGTDPLPLLALEVCINMDQFTVSSTAIQVQCNIDELCLSQQLCQYLDCVFFINQQQSISRPLIKVKDIDFQRLMDNLQGFWEAQPMKQCNQEKAHAWDQSVLQTLQRAYKTLLARKGIKEQDAKFHLVKGSLLFHIQLSIYRSQPVLASNLQYLTDFLDIDDYGARIVVLPVSKRLNCYGSICSAPNEIYASEYHASQQKLNYTVTIQNPDAICNNLHIIPTIDEFIAFSDVQAADFPADWSLLGVNRLLHYEKHAVQQSLLKSATFTLSLPEQYDKMDRVAEAEHVITLYSRLADLSVILGGAEAQRLQIMPFHGVSDLRSELLALRGVLAGSTCVLYQLAGIAVSQSAVRERGTQTGDSAWGVR